MKPREIFKLAVRILGLVFLYHGLIFFPTLFAGVFGSLRNAIPMLIMFIWPLIVAVGLLGFAPKITEFFYPEAED